ncbi:AC transposase [Actinidia chinensis var. chinensis]|uniref:AC transposase n=1 Tax=Actinidia chinensis var. chinensis TaxID=1590841 RepID=A0A2R6QI73_ACTCC|nr:AC transposase [Actinidia chinensis var. chinensis]
MEWSVNNAFKTLKDMESKSVMDMAIIPCIDPIDIGLGSSEKGNVVPAAKPRKKTMTSVYLKFFETAPDGKSRRCKFCGQSYSIATATGNLGRHLTNRHPGYDKATGDAVANPAPLPTIVIKKNQPQAKTPQVDLDYLNWVLIKWLIVASLPPSTLEEKWLANSFKFLNSSIQLWPGEKFQAVLREIFRSMREDVRAILEQVSSKVSITLDFWTSYEQIFYMSVTCQWIDENWSFQKVLLDISHIYSPCSGAEIYRTLVKVLKMYNIYNRVLSCTHDNSPEAMRSCHTLKDNIDSQKVGPFCYVPCAARTLNSIINDGLGTTKPIISKIREFVLEMNASEQIAEEFTEFATAFQEGSWKFPLDASARWSGSYQMLDIVRKAGKSIESIIRKYEESLGSRVLLSSAEKNAVNIMHAFLEPFYKTTNNICTNKLPTIGLVVFFMDHISETISACIDSRHSPDWLKSAAKDMAAKAQKYNEQVCNIFTYMTAILDPRIKVELIPESLNSDNYLEEARAHFFSNYSSNHFSSMTSGFCSAELEDGGSFSFAEEIARKKRRVSLSSTSTDELTQYLSEPPAPLPTDVLEWWKVNSTRYPRLSLMARDFLAVQATSVAPEELFCSNGDEIDKQRFSMPHNSAQALLCIKSWTEGGVRLKYKSTEIDYERLMELAASAAADNSAAGINKKQNG